MCLTRYLWRHRLLGFAALENVLYVLDTGLTTAGVRA